MVNWDGTNVYRSTNGSDYRLGHIGGYSTAGCTYAQTPNHHPDIHMYFSSNE
ncbi:MAG: hypothetical protein R3B93_20310 [Bacteroidia bacterium]